MRERENNLEIRNKAKKKYGSRSARKIKGKRGKKTFNHIQYLVETN